MKFNRLDIDRQQMILINALMLSEAIKALTGIYGADPQEIANDFNRLATDIVESQQGTD